MNSLVADSRVRLHSHGLASGTAAQTLHASRVFAPNVGVRASMYISESSS